VVPWWRPTVGVALYDGVGEIDATAAFEVFGQSAAARTVAVATGDSVRTRHGLTLLATSTSEAPALSRAVVPGATGLTAVDPRLARWADEEGLTVEALLDRTGPNGSHGRGAGGFTAALQNLALHTDTGTAPSTAAFPLRHQRSTGRGRSERTGHVSHRPHLRTRRRRRATGQSRT
jgi:hypothetical protein